MFFFLSLSHISSPMLVSLFPLSLSLPFSFFPMFVSLSPLSSPILASLSLSFRSSRCYLLSLSSLSLPVLVSHSPLPSPMLVSLSSFSSPMSASLSFSMLAFLTPLSFHTIIHSPLSSSLHSLIHSPSLSFSLYYRPLSPFSLFRPLICPLPHIPSSSLSSSPSVPLTALP